MLCIVVRIEPSEVDGFTAGEDVTDVIECVRVRPSCRTCPRFEAVPEATLCAIVKLFWLGLEGAGVLVDCSSDRPLHFMECSIFGHGCGLGESCLCLLGHV